MVVPLVIPDRLLAFPRKQSVIVAFDGLVADTLPLRAGAVANALSAEGIACNAHDIFPHMAGRSVQEAIRIVADQQTNVDETAIDLAGLRASRLCTDLMQGAIALGPGAADWIARAAMHARVGVRAESRRADVERILEAAGLTHFIAFAVTADDIRPSSTVASFAGGWARIHERWGMLHRAHSPLLGIECAEEAVCATVTNVRMVRAASLAEVPSTLPL